jgi:hypothetical protein
MFEKLQAGYARPADDDEIKRAVIVYFPKLVFS